MDFAFTQEQDLLRDSVRKFVEKDYTFIARNNLLKSDLGYSPKAWKSFAELGWTALPFSEEDGGLAGKAADIMIVLEELGKGLTLEPFISSIIFAGGVLKRGGKELRASYLPKLIEGEITAAVAYAEPDSRFSLSQVDTKAKREGDSFVLSGKKITVLGGNSADVLIVSARTSGAAGDAKGITLFAVDAKAAGLSKVSYRMVDGLRAANLTLENVKVPASQVIGKVDEGLAILEQAADEAIIALGAESVGIMEAMLKQTVAYTKERKQFGVPIASFQVLQHRMVDMFMEQEQARSMVYMATMTLDAGRPIAKAASALKVQLGKSGRALGQAAIQNHGGMGMTEELAISHYFKRLTIIDLTLGNGDFHLDRFRAIGG
jgi:alkylation response protein AidB-like acyl-CoA dehydrogenase